MVLAGALEQRTLADWLAVRWALFVRFYGAGAPSPHEYIEAFDKRMLTYMPDESTWGGQSGMEELLAMPPASARGTG